MDAFTAYEIADRKKYTEDRTFEDVVKYVEKKIATAATLGHRDTICSIPIYMPDTPAFDRSSMLEDIMHHLTNKGFYCRPCPSCTVYISWRYATELTRESVQVERGGELLMTRAQ